tara:strand:+ start:189 stop:497 length:309 start_codon:yes stop_codon:yes gene_type:complete
MLLAALVASAAAGPAYVSPIVLDQTARIVSNQYGDPQSYPINRTQNQLLNKVNKSDTDGGVAKVAGTILSILFYWTVIGLLVIPVSVVIGIFVGFLPSLILG